MVEPKPQPVLRQRLDKWLFFTRLQKSRSIAQKTIEAGDVRVNGIRIGQASHLVKPGDIVIVALDRRDVTVRFRLAGDRRGPYEEARLLYDDLTPVEETGEKASQFQQATRERGLGRPTKRDRRALDRLQPDWQDE